eukprot:164359-Chlamydomonas_euryale.AAC.1
MGAYAGRAARRAVAALYANLHSFVHAHDTPPVDLASVGPAHAFVCIVNARWALSLPSASTGALLDCQPSARCLLAPRTRLDLLDWAAPLPDLGSGRLLCAARIYTPCPSLDVWFCSL